MRAYKFVLIFAITIPTSFFIPTPLDDLTINVNLNEPPQGWKDDEFEADYDNDNDNKPTIVIIGGVSKDEEVLKDAEMFGKKDSKWTALTPQLDRGRYHMAAVSVKNTIYVIGGKGPKYDKDELPVPLFTQRNADENKWKEFPELQKARFQHTATAFDTEQGSMIVVTGGDGGPNNHKDPAKSTEVYIFGKGKGKWDTVADLNYGRCSHSALIFKGTLHVMGGRDPTEEHTGQTGNIVESFLFSEQISWKTHSLMNEGRESHGATVAFNKMYVCGGKKKNKKGETDYIKTCEWYNEGISPPDWWTDRYEMKKPREGFGMVAIGIHKDAEFIWAIGGYNKGGVEDSVEYYRENIGWTLERKEHSLIKPRMFHGTALYIPSEGDQARTIKLESANIVNSTYV